MWPSFERRRKIKLKEGLLEEAVHIYFSGRVQGVGFRFTAKSLALKHKVNGWVRNLADGRVELLAQGNPKSIISFLNDLRIEFKGYIINEEVRWLSAQDRMEGFVIKF